MNVKATMLDTLTDPSWYPNSRATNHYIFNPTILSNKQDYNDLEKKKIYMGNGDN